MTGGARRAGARAPKAGGLAPPESPQRGRQGRGGSRGEAYSHGSSCSSGTGAEGGRGKGPEKSSPRPPRSPTRPPGGAAATEQSDGGGGGDRERSNRARPSDSGGRAGAAQRAQRAASERHRTAAGARRARPDRGCATSGGTTKRRGRPEGPARSDHTQPVGRARAKRGFPAAADYAAGKRAVAVCASGPIGFRD